MKKRIALILSAAAMLSLCSCGSKGSSSDSQGETRNMVVRSMTHEASRIKHATSIQQLRDDADIIIEAEVTGVRSECFEDSGSIRTYLDVDVINEYKGSYDGSELYFFGGRVPADEYVPNKDVNFTLTDEERKNGLVEDNWFNIGIPEKGDTIIFFGKEEDGRYYALYDMQGLFECSGDEVRITSLEVQSDGQPEPLAQELHSKCGAEYKQKDASLEAVINKEMFMAAIA